MYMQDVDAEIIIVGSGISGLTAAYTLLEKEPTLRVLVLEKSGRTGGRVLSVPLKVGPNSFSTFDLGAEYIVSDQTELLNLLQKTGVSIRRFDRPIGNAIFRIGGRDIVVKKGDNIFSYLSPNDRLQFTRFVVNIETLCKNVKNEPSYETVNELCVQSLDQYIKNSVESDRVKSLIKYIVLTNIGVPPAKISVLFYIFYCISNKGIENQLNCVRDKRNYLSILGGAQTICELISEQIGRYSVLRDEEVVSIKSNQRFIEVVSKKKSCYSVIMAVSPKSALSINFHPPLQAEEINAFLKTNTGITTTFVIIYSTAFWKEMDFSGGIYFLEECLIRPNVILLYFCDSSDDNRAAISGQVFEYGDQPSRYSGGYKDVILEELRHYFGRKCLNPMDYYEFCWRDDFGKMFAWDLGVFSYVGYSFTSSEQRIFWAGAETSTEWYGSLAGAVHSGKRAAFQALYDRRPSALTPSDMDVLMPLLKKKKVQFVEYNDPVYKAFVHWKYYSILTTVVLFLLWRFRKYIKQ